MIGELCFAKASQKQGILPNASYEMTQMAGFFYAQHPKMTRETDFSLDREMQNQIPVVLQRVQMSKSDG